MTVSDRPSTIPSQASCRNRLLALMAPADFAALAPFLEPVPLPRGLVLVAAGGTITHVYFPEAGVGSIVATLSDDLEVETGLFGREGMGPTPLVMGSEHSVQRVIIQVEGEGYRIAGARLVDRFGESASLRRLLLPFVQVMHVQASYTALTNAVHTVNERLARWLLMSHDRVDGNVITLTHEFLSVMLAVRRPTVTTSLHTLEGNGLIHTERGHVVIQNRGALEDYAGDAYGRPEAEYARLIGPM